MALYDWMTPEERQMIMSNQLIGLGAGMLQNSGYSPVRQTTGQALGSGLSGMLGAAKSSMGDIQDKRKMEMQKTMMDNSVNFQKEYGSGFQAINALWDELDKIKKRQGGPVYMNNGGF